MIGTAFGPYRIVSLLGRGGMGEVYRAVDTSHGGRLVALKVLVPAVSADPHYAARFRREAEAAARVHEPHIVAVHRYGVIDGRLFLDMQLVEGRGLDDVVAADGGFDPDRAIAIVAQVASALDAVHAAGLVHRDIKPANLMLSGSGTASEFAYLLDFGIATAVEPGSRTAVTRTGTIVGTLAYMAPERFHAQAAGPAADVYSLACVLFELLTGRRPYPEPGVEAQLAGHLHQPPPLPSTVRTGLPPGFDDVVAWGMAKDPRARPAAAGELVAAARAVLNTGRSSVASRHRASAVYTAPAVAAPPPQPPARVRRPWLWRVGAGVSAAVVAAVLTTTLVPQTEAPAAPASAATPPAAAVTLTERTLVGRGGDAIEAPTVAAIGDRHVLVITDVAAPVVVVDLATGQPVGKPIDGRLISSATAMTLDGRAVVVTGGADGVIRLWDLETGAALPTAMAGHAGLVAAVATAEVDGRTVVVSSGTDNTLRRWDLRTGAQIGEPAPMPGTYAAQFTVAAVAGRPVVLAVVARKIHVWDLASGAPVGSPIPHGTLVARTVDLPGRGTAVLTEVDREMALHDLSTGVATPLRSERLGLVLPVVVGGRTLLADAHTTRIQLVDLATGAPIGAPMTGHEGAVSSMTAVEQDGSTFLVSISSTDRSVRIWDLTKRARG